jgi:hypothetical protein
MTEQSGFVPSWCAEFPSDNPALHEGISWVCLDLCGPPRPVIRPRSPVRHAASALPAAVPAAPEPAVEAAPVEVPALALDLGDIGPSNAEAAATSCEPLELDVVEVTAQKAAPVDAVFEFDADEGAPEATSPARVVEESGPCVAEGAPAEARASVPAIAESPAALDPFAAYVSAVVEVAEAAGHTRAAAALPMLLEGADFDPSVLPEEAQARLIAARILVRSEAAVSPSDGFTSMAGAWRSVLRGLTNDLSACGATTLDGWSADLLSAFGVGQGGATDVRRELRRRGVAAFGMLLAA